MGIVEAYLTARGDQPVEAFSTYVLTSDIAPNTLAGALAFGLTAKQYRTIIDLEILELDASIAEISGDLADKRQQIDTAEASLQEMDRRIGLLESSYAYLSEKLQEARIALAESPDPIRVIDEPLIPTLPIAPKNMKNIAIAGFLGLIVGTLFAFFVDYLARVREREKAAEALASSDHPRGNVPNEQPQEGGADDGEQTLS